MLAAGADFRLLGRGRDDADLTKPVVAVCAVRTGCGKSQTTPPRRPDPARHGQARRVIRGTRCRTATSRRRRVQRFATLEDMDAADCTIEEREEYEPHIAEGQPRLAGVDYEAILRQAEQEADVILWDGGNNDSPFYRAGPATSSSSIRTGPGTSCATTRARRTCGMADLVIMNKVDTADRRRRRARARRRTARSTPRRA